jgi:hypothetical protein
MSLLFFIDPDNAITMPSKSKELFLTLRRALRQAQGGVMAFLGMLFYRIA